MKNREWNSHRRWTIRIATILTIAMATLGNQLFQPPTVQAQETETATAQDENSRVRKIYESTKTAKTVADYSDLLSECDQALSGKLTEKNRAYIASLRGWALNRRGNLRFEIAEQLAQAGNGQSKQMLAKAMADYDDAIRADKNRWRSWMSRGIARVSAREFEQAVEDFSKVTELKTDETSAWFNRAEANYHAGNFAAAVADYGTVLAVNANDVQARTGRGHAYYGLAQFEQALEDYTAVADTVPNHPESMLNLGDAHQMLGRWEAAKDCYASSIKLKTTAKGLQRLAWFHATCPDLAFRDPAQAQSLIDQAILMGGEVPANLDTLAAVQAANGNFNEAKTTQQKAIQLVSGEESDPVKSQYQSRLAMYEEGVPFKQDKQD